MSWQAIPLLLLLYLLNVVFSCEDYCRYTCDYTKNYTTNSTFSFNLAQSLNTLPNNTAPTGFNTTTAGGPTQQATALALCRGSLSPSDCQTCIAAAVAGIRLVCPDHAAGQIWYDYCMIRYSDANFLGKVNTSIEFLITDPTFAPDPDSYVESVLFLMENLSSSATASGERYAVGRTELLHNNTLYGYFDCTRDISAYDCAKCFSTVTAYVRLWCVTLRICWILTPSCNVQVSMDPAHADWVNAPLLINNVTRALSPNTGGGNDGSSGSVRGGSGGNLLKDRVTFGLFGTLILLAGLLIVGVIISLKRGKVEREYGEEMMRREGIDMRSNYFNLDELIIATENFSPSNLLGSGGFGTVYKGTMPNGEDIAVKKLANSSIQGLGEFFNEVKVLLNMQHRNLVRLLGYCVQGEERILVYEYLPNNSLGNTLFDKSKSALLDWSKRYNIILGIARGLLYLHEDSSLRIIHRDIKASNILLDEQMNPKISDFGLAKLFTNERSHVSTRQIAGTFGYMAPEYANRGLLSMKSDMFSFGVLILEIISGRKNYEIEFDDEQRQLLNFAWKLELEGRLIELVDEILASFPGDEAARCMQIGLLCCQECIQDRPTISSALSMLSNTSGSTIPQAGRPGYHQESVNHEAMPQLGGDGLPTNNPEVNSITTSLLVQGR